MKAKDLLTCSQKPATSPYLTVVCIESTPSQCAPLASTDVWDILDFVKILSVWWMDTYDLSRWVNLKLINQTL
jgi:hypothetical protein